MRGTSPNVFKSFNDSIRAKYGRTESQTCADDSSCLGITKGSVGIFNFHGKIVSGHRPQWGYDNKLAFTFTDAGRLEADDGDFLAVPADLLAAGVPVYLIRGADKLSWPKSSHSDLFLMDKNGIISPQLAPKLAFGIDHDVTYTFRPRNPHEACLPCHQLAPELFDKIQCDGGTQVQSAAGYMILHTQGSRKVHVHKCPNKAACPGSKLRLTAEGQTSSRSVLCAEGYQRSPGCILCSPGYGRPPLDPFICQACGSASHVQQISLATLASGIFFAIALNSARPRRGTQQIFKVFLAFLTISCRSLSAVPYTLQFQRLKQP
ncbi:pmp10 [Symbiodinium pilosum]|uniref:Pmp10 protein n=1 Tax=Symbiodinium pilosum TaxID=2952 RepID=A0A812LF54_SYMPI|nr:pmp10 [Symbiodinium pilosum]